MDSITGIGGFPRGRLSEVFGWEGSGKTILCTTACAAAQAGGLYVAYIDPEHGLDLNLATKLGFEYRDERKGVYLTPQTFEETVKIVHELALSGEPKLIIVDSIPGMVPHAVLDGEIDETGALGAVARLLASVLPRLTKTIAEKNVALVMTNQMRKIIYTNNPWAAKYGPQEQSSGGSALKFYSSLRLNLRQVKKGSSVRKEIDPYTDKEIEVPVASQHEAEAFKNKVAVPYRKATFYIRFDPATDTFGIDNLQTICDLAVYAGIIVRKGSFFTYTAGDTNFSVQGASGLYAYLQEHPEVVTQLKASLRV